MPPPPFFTRDPDEKIVHACNELMQERTISAELHVEQEAVYRKIQQDYQTSYQQWKEKCKINIKKIDTSIHLEQVREVFEDKDDDEEEDEGNPSSSSSPLSPFLLSRLSNLCYHVHFMTLLESFVKSIHEDYRVIICWMHEDWEKMETEMREMRERQETANEGLAETQQQHANKMRALQRSHAEEKRTLLQTLLAKQKDATYEETSTKNADRGGEQEAGE